MAKKKVSSESILFAFLGVFLTIIGFLVVLLARKKDKYAMYYAKHGLVLFVAWVAVSIVGLIPFVGWIVSLVGGIGLLILWVITFIGALSGEQKKIILITEFAKKIDL